jgi:hypothetical protein
MSWFLSLQTFSILSQRQLIFGSYHLNEQYEFGHSKNI